MRVSPSRSQTKETRTVQGMPRGFSGPSGRTPGPFLAFAPPDALAYSAPRDTSDGSETRPGEEGTALPRHKGPGAGGGRAKEQAGPGGGRAPLPPAPPQGPPGAGGGGGKGRGGAAPRAVSAGAGPGRRPAGSPGSPAGPQRPLTLSPSMARGGGRAGRRVPPPPAASERAGNGGSCVRACLATGGEGDAADRPSDG